MSQPSASLETPPPAAFRGDFMETPFPRVFHRLCRDKATGYLDIRDQPREQGGKILKRVVIAEGHSFAVQGGSVEETLPMILAGQGRISEDQLSKLKEECGGDYAKMEQKVMSGAVIPFHELAELAGLQVSQKIRSLAALIKGPYEFKPLELKNIYKKHALYRLSPEKILLQGVTEHYPPARIQKEFPGIENKNFTLKPGAEQILADMGAPPEAARQLKGLSSFTWNSILKKPPVPEAEAAALLFALYLGEVAVLAEGEDDFPVGRAYLEAEESKLEKLRKEAEAKEKQKAEEETKKKAEEQKPEDKKLPIEVMLEKEMTDQELLAEIDNFLKVLNDPAKNYFDAFGVPEQAPQAKIKQVYFKFARKFHPDARHDLFVDKVRDKVEDLFARMTEIYDLLSDTEKRAEYLKELRSHVSKEDMEKAKRAIEAEMEFQKAEITIRRGAFAEARDLLTRVTQLQPDEPEYEIYLNWVNYKLGGPGESARAARAIKQLLEKRPKCADGYFFLGQIFKADGELDQAENQFKQAHQLKPMDADIKRELMLIQRRKLQTASTPKKGGLFGKKK